VDEDDIEAFAENAADTVDIFLLTKKNVKKKTKKKR